MNEEREEAPPVIDEMDPVVAANSRPLPAPTPNPYLRARESSDCQRFVYILLALFLGFLGVHNFYARRLWPALGELFGTLIGMVLIAPLAIVAVCILVEICCVKADGEGRWMR
jgi:hypothetical protein